MLHRGYQRAILFFENISIISAHRSTHGSLLTTYFSSHVHTDTSFLFFLNLPYQWEAWKFSAPVLHVLESCAFRPELVGSCGAQCVLLTPAPAVLRRPCMALESCQTPRGCPGEWGSMHVSTKLLQNISLPSPVAVKWI